MTVGLPGLAGPEREGLQFKFPGPASVSLAGSGSERPGGRGSARAVARGPSQAEPCHRDYYRRRSQAADAGSDAQGILIVIQVPRHSGWSRSYVADITRTATVVLVLYY